MSTNSGTYVKTGKMENMGYGFLGEGKYGEDEFHFRNIQNGPDSAFRHLTADEIRALEANNNRAENWENVLVRDPFTPDLVRDNRFYGKVRIGKIPYETLRFHDLCVPMGITGSTVISSDICDFSAVHNVGYLSHYIVRENCILFRVNEIQCTNHSKFGNGILKEGEDPDVLVEMWLMNENGNRPVLPFEDIQVSDAFLWANWPEDRELSKALKKMTFERFSSKRGYYGEIGKGCVIKGVGIIKDVKFGPCCYVKGATKLKNLTIRSSYEAPTQIGESCELVNGIVGYGCKVFYGCKAVRFVMCENSQLKYGGRLIHSMLGENSTVSCCELISNLVFPFHEQHHNNSFLISSLIQGQSNMAAGANIGSNHNSRGADGELRAGRGFWPALSSTIKFDSRFASFVLIAKGNYDYELNIKTPFSLVSDSRREGRRQVMPAYWWMYNMYALERNSDKFSKRDGRKMTRSFLETDYLAPDTAWEIFDGMRLLGKWTAYSLGCEGTENELELQGREILENHPSDLSGKEVIAMHQENYSRNRMLVLHPVEAYNAYRAMLIYYGTKETVAWCAKTGMRVSELEKLSSQAHFRWVNLGGRLVPESVVDNLRHHIACGDISTWDQVHALYEKWDSEYPLEKAKNAMFCLKKILGIGNGELDLTMWNGLVLKLAETRKYIDRQVYETRCKDYRNKFRMVTYRGKEEQEAVLGKLEDNSFVRQSAQKTARMLENAAKCVF